jgi:hypothetical protein
MPLWEQLFHSRWVRPPGQEVHEGHLSPYPFKDLCRPNRITRVAGPNLLRRDRTD